MSDSNSDEQFEDVVTRLSLHDNIQTCFETWYQRDDERLHEVRYDRAEYQFILAAIHQCSICLGDICENLFKTDCKPVNHKFHRECLDRWLLKVKKYLKTFYTFPHRD